MPVIKLPRLPLNVSTLLYDLRFAVRSVSEAISQRTWAQSKFVSKVSDALREMRTEAERVEVLTTLYWSESSIELMDLEHAWWLSIPTNGSYTEQDKRKWRSLIARIRKAHPTIPCTECGRLITVNRRMTWDWTQKCETCEKRASDEFSAYLEREATKDARVCRLREMPYSEYLQTPEWHTVRLECLKAASYKCQVCNGGNTSLDVHHRTYERRGQELPSDTIVLCRRCHAMFHGKLAKDEQ